MVILSNFKLLEQYTRQNRTSRLMVSGPSPVQTGGESDCYYLQELNFWFILSFVALVVVPIDV